MIFRSTQSSFLTYLKTFIPILACFFTTNFSYAQLDPSVFHADFDPSQPNDIVKINQGSANNDLKNDFIVYDEMRFRNKPDLRHLGLTDIRVVYAAEMWPKGGFSSTINEEYLRRFFRRFEFNNAEIVCLDIEHWPIDIRRDDAESVKAGINKYIRVVEIFKEENPNTLIGFYGVPPIRDYFSPVRNRNKEDWHQANDELAILADKVDVLFPSIYTFYHRQSEWKKYAIANINEAKRFGKKVYPFIWPMYHDSNRILNNHYIGSTYWKLQLETVYEHADGVVIWTRGHKPPQWNPSAKWWKTTREFLINKQIAN